MNAHQVHSPPDNHGAITEKTESRMMSSIKSYASLLV